MTLRLDRQESLHTIEDPSARWDVVVIGGGATGVGIALDAASRGWKVALLERFDFGSGTSSRSTKLVHGGVRYLRQGNMTLVRDALRERALLRQNAPHCVHDQAFLIPCENSWQRFFYGVGLKLYDLLAAGDQFGRSRMVSAETARQTAASVRRERSRGGVLYHDGQFDDSRLLIDMAQTAADHGACLINHTEVTELIKDDDGRVRGVVASDRESGQQFELRAAAVINAAGPFCDAVRQLDDHESQPMVAASQGVHLVLPQSFFQGQTAMIVPKTPDGRVIFVVPWLGHAIVGTTDTAIPNAVAEPNAKPEEIEFLLETAGRYLSRPPTLDDVLSVFTGIRPLVRGDKSARTASLSRDHVIRVADSGLITITGGKWTTVRKMAEDCVDRAAEIAGLSAAGCRTQSLAIRTEREQGLNALESETTELSTTIHPSLSIRRSEIVWAARHEMARTVEDALARRTRALFLNARAAVEAAPSVAESMAAELGLDASWRERQLEAFNRVAKYYLPPSPE